MPSLTAESQAVVQNDRPSVRDGRSNALRIGEDFHGPGFRFVRSFLWVILTSRGLAGPRWPVELAFQHGYDRGEQGSH